MRHSSFLLALGASLLLGGCHKDAPPPPPLQHVNALEVQPHNVEYVFSYPGVVQGVIDYPVIPRVSGAIFKQLYKEGSLVKKDQPLYEIDRRPYLFALQNAEGQLQKDQAANDNYRIIYERYQSLTNKDVTSVQDVNTALINYQAAAGNLKTSIANVDNAKLNLEYCTVRAPASGYISERMISEGMMVTAFQTQLNVINSRDSMYVAFSMPELDRLTIENGGLDGRYQIPDEYRFTVDLTLADGSKIPTAGKVEFRDIRVSFSDGVWQLRASIDNKALPRNKLLPGQFVHVFLRDLVVLNTFVVPQEAIFRDRDSSFVFILEGDKVKKQRVNPGKYLLDGTQLVDEGLSPGMKVVTNGGVRIEEGQQVITDELKHDQDGETTIAPQTGEDLTPMIHDSDR
jgi:membrane fusion protein (multidrug efflux system)